MCLLACNMGFLQIFASEFWECLRYRTSYIHCIVLSFIIEYSVNIYVKIGHRSFGYKSNHIDTSISYMYNMCMCIYIYVICIIYMCIIHIYRERERLHCAALSGAMYPKQRVSDPREVWQSSLSAGYHSIYSI